MVRPWWSPARPEVRATSRMCSARWAFEHHVFWPLTTYPSPRRSARQLRFATSEPASGSDIATASMTPRATPDRISFFCAGVPNRW